jgi:integrase
MTVRGFKEDTRRDYVRHVRAFAVFVGRSPDTATAEDLRLFQLHQTQSGMQPPSINSAVSALRFLFTVTLDRPDLARRLTVVPYPRRIPAVLSVEEVTFLLRAATAPKYKAVFATAYGAMLRASEVVALKVGDSDSERVSSHLTPRWSGMDSNFRFRARMVTVPSLRALSTSLKLFRFRRKTRRPQRPKFRNPLPPTGESSELRYDRVIAALNGATWGSVPIVVT